MIEMIAGVFGLHIKNKKGDTIRVKGMGPNDGPFSTTPEREAELVKMGIARYVKDEETAESATNDDGGAPIGFDETPPEYNADMKVDELREIGKLYGLTFKVGMSKVEMVAALDALFAGSDDEAETDNEDEETEESAPTFDPAEAVQ